jgi:hypothetical protein
LLAIAAAGPDILVPNLVLPVVVVSGLQTLAAESVSAQGLLGIKIASDITQIPIAATAMAAERCLETFALSLSHKLTLFTITRFFLFAIFYPRYLPCI